MKKYLFSIFFIFLFCGSLRAEIEGLVYVNNVQNLTEEQFQRILSPEIGYVLVQVHVGQGKDKETERIRKLGEKGKKIIVQFWWGPGGRYNWSYHSLLALAYDGEVREDFFKGIDKTIEAIGAKNIYGAHFFEELFHYGVDIVEAGDWKLNKYRIVDGKAGVVFAANPYTNPHSDCRWSPHAPNLRRFNDVFKKETGLDMRKAAIWRGEENFVFHRWAKKTSARAEISLFKHLRKKHPNIKRFTWSYMGYHSSPAVTSDFGLLREYLDGIISNSYFTANVNYQNYSAFRIICPQAKLLVLLYGGYRSKDVKRRLMTAAYIAGAEGIGFFEGQPAGVCPHVHGRKEDAEFAKYYSGKGEGMDYEDSTIWGINTSLISEFKKLPPFHKEKGPILLISGNADRNWWTHRLVFTGLKSFDKIPADYAHLVDLKDYALVIAHDLPFSDHSYFYKRFGVPGPGLDEKRIEDYVKKGGILFISGTGPLPSFLKDYLERQGSPYTQELTYQPDEFFKKRFNLDNEYHLLLRRYKVRIKSEEVKEGLGYLLPYGKGLIYYAPFTHGERKSDSLLYGNYRKFVTDILRGLLLYQGKEKIAKEALADKGTGYQYMEVRDKDIVAYFQFPKEGKITEFKIKGIDLLTGEKNPKFGPERTAVIIRKN